MDGHVGLDLDVGLDPGRGGIDDRHAGEHVVAVDPVAEDSRRRSASSARVLTPSTSNGSAAMMRRDRLAVADEKPDRVGEVELALGVVRLEPLERRPELSRCEDVDRRSSPRGSRARRGVASRGLDDPRTSCRRRHGRRGRSSRASGGSNAEHGRGRAAGAVRRRASSASSSAVSSGDVAGEDEHVAAEVLRALVRAARTASPVPRGALLDGDLDSPSKPSRACGRATTTSGSAPAATRREDHPVDHAAAEQRVEVLRHRGTHARSEAGGHDDCCDRGVAHVGWDRWLGRQDSNLGSRDQNPLPYRLATPHCGPSIGARPPRRQRTTGVRAR